jgi:hypothetical protein
VAKASFLKGVHPKASGNNIKNEAGISERDKKGQDAVRSPLYEQSQSKYNPAAAKSSKILNAGKPFQTIQNDEGMKESDKYGKQLSKSISSDGYEKAGDSGRLIGGLPSVQTIKNDEGLKQGVICGKSPLNVKLAEETGDYGKSGKAEVVRRKIPTEEIFAREMGQEDYSDKNVMGHPKANDSDGVNEY